MLDNYIIRDLNHKEYTKEQFLELLKQNDKDGFDVYVGTDSQVIKNKISIVTAICFRKEGQSGKVFYVKEKISRTKYPNLRTRMLLEAFRSLELAMEVDPYVSGNLEVHLDIGGTIKNKTSSYEKELTSLVSAQGYSCKIKPDSWASSSVADRVVKS